MFGKAGHDEQGVVKSVSLRPEEVPMVARVNRQILLESRPEGAPSLDNFTLKQGSVPEPGHGEVLMRMRWLSLDPYMRGRMSAAKSYAMPVEVGATMVGGWIVRQTGSDQGSCDLGRCDFLKRGPFFHVQLNDLTKPLKKIVNIKT
jgi:N-terminal domain of oxidoreductase